MSEWKSIRIEIELKLKPRFSDTHKFDKDYAQKVHSN